MGNRTGLADLHLGGPISDIHPYISPAPALRPSGRPPLPSTSRVQHIPERARLGSGPLLQTCFYITPRPRLSLSGAVRWKTGTADACARVRVACVSGCKTICKTDASHIQLSYTLFIELASTREAQPYSMLTRTFAYRYYPVTYENCLLWGNFALTLQRDVDCFDFCRAPSIELLCIAFTPIAATPRILR